MSQVKLRMGIRTAKKSGLKYQLVRHPFRRDRSAAKIVLSVAEYVKLLKRWPDASLYRLYCGDHIDKPLSELIDNEIKTSAPPAE